MFCYIFHALEVKFDRVNFSNVNTNGFALWEAALTVDRRKNGEFEAVKQGETSF